MSFLIEIVSLIDFLITDKRKSLDHSIYEVFFPLH